MQGIALYQGSGYTATQTVMLLHTLVPVEPSKRYEFSIYSGSHRASVITFTMWLDAAGNQIGGLVADLQVTNDEQAAGGQSLASFRKIGHFGVAPSGAVQARFYIEKRGTKQGYSDSFAFLVAPMVAEAGSSQTVFSSYSPSGLGTKITGEGIETRSITAANMVVGTITAGSGVIGDLAVDTLQIAGNAVTVPSSVSGSSYGTTLRVNLVGGQPVYVSCLADGGAVRYDESIPRYANLYINGSVARSVTSVCAFFNTARYDVQIALIHNFTPFYTGEYTFHFDATGNEYAAHIFVIQTKR
jgi:hypothetical protein